MKPIKFDATQYQERKAAKAELRKNLPTTSVKELRDRVTLLEKVAGV